MSESEFPLGDKLHEIIRDMICREIDTIFDAMDEVKESITGRFERLEDRSDKLSEAVLQLDERVARRLKDLEEFTGLYNDNEIEDARTSEQIKSDVKKRRQNEKSKKG